MGELSTVKNSSISVEAEKKRKQDNTIKIMAGDTIFMAELAGGSLSEED